jgi:hypothetical protein
VARVGVLDVNGIGRFAPFESVPEEPPPPDPDPDPTGPITHGSQVTTANTGFVGLGYDTGDLTTVGGISSSAHGQVIELLKVNGTIRINHNNVTVRACWINGPLGSHCISFANTGIYGTIIEFCRIHQSLTQGGDSNGVSGIYHTPAGRAPQVVRRCHITHVADGAKLSGGWVFEKNYWAPTIKYGSTHNDGVQSQKSSGAFDPSVIVRDNKFIGGADFGNALVFFTGESGDQFNADIARNLFQAGPNTVGVAIHGQDNPGGIGAWKGIITCRDNWFVQGYNGGPEGYFSLNTVPNDRVVRTGNRRVALADYADLGPVS